MKLYSKILTAKLKNIFFFLLISFLVISLDQVSKYLIHDPLKEGFFIIPNFLKITYFENKGVAFGIKLNQILIYGLILLFLIIVLIFFEKVLFERKWKAVFMGFVFGGAISNVIDRITVGAVKDIFEFYYFSAFPSGLVFNLADVFIVVGTISLIIFFWREEKCKMQNAKIKM